MFTRLWNHFRVVNIGSKSSENGIPDEIEIEGECFNEPQTVAAKLNEESCIGIRLREAV